mgnify:CR=1 FL=1
MLAPGQTIVAMRMGLFVARMRVSVRVRRPLVAMCVRMLMRMP